MNQADTSYYRPEGSIKQTQAIIGQGVIFKIFKQRQRFWAGGSFCFVWKYQEIKELLLYLIEGSFCLNKLGEPDVKYSYLVTLDLIGVF